MDSDNDGVSDANEAADGTDPLDPSSALAYPFTVTKLQGVFSVTTKGRDACALVGQLPGMAAGFNPTGAVMTVDIGGAEATFTLAANGKASGSAGKAALKLKSSVRDKATKRTQFAGGALTFSAVLLRGTWSDAWSLIGLDASADVKAAPATVPVLVAFNGRLYAASVPVKLTAKAGKGGKYVK